MNLQKLQLETRDTVYLSVITVSELLQGIHRASPEVRRIERSAFVEELLSRFEILDIGIGAARIHAALYTDLRTRGRTIGINDSWIAATCLSHELTLVTLNVREFSSVGGLRLEVPST